MKVRTLPKDPGPAGWNRLLRTDKPADELEGAQTADWLIIGAGFAGLAAAYHLSKIADDARIVVLDATRVGEGPAGRNSGFMIDLPHDLTSNDYGGALETDRAQIEDNRLGIAHAQAMANDFGLDKECFDLCGKINGAITQRGARHNVSFAAHLDALNEPYEQLDAEQMRSLTGSAAYSEGLFTPGTAMIQPAKYVRGVADGLRSNRVHIHENSPVTSLEKQRDWVASTPKGRITAPKVILAVNGHLNSFGHAAQRLMHVHTYASMTRAMTVTETAQLGGASQWGITPADPMGTTVRRISGEGGERVVVRHTFTYDPSLAANEKQLPSIYAEHDTSFRARFPNLAGVTMEYRWGGRLCLSRNNVQVIGEIDDDLYSACCQNGLGTAKGTLAGRLAADLAMGRSSAALDRALKAPEPQKLPPSTLMNIGAKAHLAYTQFAAGREK